MQLLLSRLRTIPKKSHLSIQMESPILPMEPYLTIQHKIIGPSPCLSIHLPCSIQTSPPPVSSHKRFWVHRKETSWAWCPDDLLATVAGGETSTTSDLEHHSKHFLQFRLFGFLQKQHTAKEGSGLPSSNEECCVVPNYLLVMTPLKPVPKHLLIRKEISICGSGRALLKLHVWRGWAYSGQGSLTGVS